MYSGKVPVTVIKIDHLVSCRGGVYNLPCVHRKDFFFFILPKSLNAMCNNNKKVP